MYALLGVGGAMLVVVGVFLPWHRVLRRPAADGWRDVPGVDAAGGPLALALGAAAVVLLVAGAMFAPLRTAGRLAMVAGAVAAGVAAVTAAWTNDVWRFLWGSDVVVISRAGFGRYLCMISGGMAAVFGALAAARSAHADSRIGS